MIESQTPGSDQDQSTGKNGKKKIRFLVLVQLPNDVEYLSRVISLAIENSVVIEQVVNSSKNRFVIDIPEKDEDYFERLLGYSSNVISWHIQHKKEQ